MNIDQVRRLKSELESIIRSELQSFTRMTGMRVTDLDLTRKEFVATGPAGAVYEVHVRVEV